LVGYFRNLAAGSFADASIVRVPGVVGRSAEFRPIASFLDSAGAHPSALLMQRDAGVGETTLWLAADRVLLRAELGRLMGASGQ
jgi:hypothetical protein